LVSHEHKCVFVHVPKVAGMSIEYALGVDIYKLHAGPLEEKHGRPDEGTHAEWFDPYFSFAFVRNPWDRVVSAFCFDLKQMDGGSWNPRRRAIELECERDFSRFVVDILPWAQNAEIYRRQLSWLAGFEFDFVGRFERLQQDFDRVCAAIGCTSAKLLSINSSDHVDYREFYDPVTRDTVAHLYSDDIELLGYEFDGLAKDADAMPLNEWLADMPRLKKPRRDYVASMGAPVEEGQRLVVRGQGSGLRVAGLDTLFQQFIETVQGDQNE